MPSASDGRAPVRRGPGRLRPARGSILFAALLVLSSGPAFAELWYEHYEKGEAALKAQNWAEAVEQLTSAIEKNGTPGANVRTYGMNFINYHPYLKLGIAYYNLGEHEAALRAFDTELQFGAVTKSPSDHGNLQAFRQLAEKGQQEAVASEQERIETVVARALNEAEILESQGRLDDAMAAVSKALAVDEDNASAAQVLQRLRGRAAEVERQRELDTRIAGLQQQGQSLLDSGDYEQASSVLAQAFDLRPDAETKTLLDRSRERLRAQLQTERDEQSRRSTVVDGLAEARRLEAQRDFAGALAELESVLALTPDDAEAQSLQSRILAARTQVQQETLAADQIGRLLDEGAGLLKNGRIDEAVATLNRVIALDPNNGSARTYLTQAFRALNQSILGGTAPVLVKIPPTIALLNRAEHEVTLEVDGQARQLAEERVASSSFTLAGTIFDDQPTLKIAVFDALGETAGGAAPQPSAEESLQGEKFGANLYRFDFSRNLSLTTRTAAWKIVATDTDGLSAETIHRVSYARPWSRSPWLYALIGLLATSALALYQGLRIRRRNLLLKRHFNPYVAGTPILKDDMFFGRQRLMARVLQSVHNNSIMLYGERRIGKTSFQHLLKRRLEQLDDPDYRFYPAYIDLQGTPEDQFFRTLADGVYDEYASILDGWRPGQSLEAGAPYTYQMLVRDMREVLKRLKNKSPKNPKLVLLIDEVDELNDYDPKINQRLRSLFMKSFAENLVAVVSGVGIKKRWESEGSPWYNFFEEIPVKPFTREDAVELIERPIRGVFKLERGVVDEIIRRTDCRPYLIQKLCVKLVNRAHENGSRRIAMEDVQVTQSPLEV